MANELINSGVSFEADFSHGNTSQQFNYLHVYTDADRSDSKSFCITNSYSDKREFLLPRLFNISDASNTNSELAFISTVQYNSTLTKILVPPFSRIYAFKLSNSEDPSDEESSYIKIPRFDTSELYDILSRRDSYSSITLSQFNNWDIAVGIHEYDDISGDSLSKEKLSDDSWYGSPSHFSQIKYSGIKRDVNDARATSRCRGFNPTYGNFYIRPDFVKCFLGPSKIPTYTSNINSISIINDSIEKVNSSSGRSYYSIGFNLNLKSNIVDNYNWWVDGNSKYISIDNNGNLKYFFNSEDILSSTTSSNEVLDTYKDIIFKIYVQDKNSIIKESDEFIISNLVVSSNLDSTSNSISISKRS